MSKILVRGYDENEIEYCVGEEAFWWVLKLAQHQGIGLQITPLEGRGFDLIVLPDEEAPRCVDLLEFAANEVLADKLKNPKDDEEADYLRRCQGACRHVAAFTAGGGWRVVA